MGIFAKLVRDERGATAIEYAMIISLIVVVMIAGLTHFADTTINMWNFVEDSVTSV